MRLCSKRCRLSNQTNFQSGIVYPMADVFLTTKQKVLKTKYYTKINAENLVGGDDGKRRKEFAVWHNYA